MAFLEDFHGEATTLGFLMTLVTAGVGFWRWARTRNKIPKVEITNPPPALPPAGIHMDLATFAAMQERGLEQARRQLVAAHGEERKRLEDKIDALNARLADPDRALAEQQAIITRLEAQLSRQVYKLGGDAINDAKAALEAGDFTKARALFETLAAETEPDVQAHAQAAFALGEIAEAEIRWADAAAHYARAARLNPTAEALHKATDLMERPGGPNP